MCGDESYIDLVCRTCRRVRAKGRVPGVCMPEMFPVVASLCNPVWWKLFAMSTQHDN